MSGGSLDSGGSGGEFGGDYRDYRDIVGEGAAWSAGRRLSPFEAVVWRNEADVRTRATLTVVYLLDAAPEWERLLAAHDWASRVVPRFRQRVVEAPYGIGRPRWVSDPDLDWAYHLRRVRVSGPHAMREVLDLAQAVAVAPLDRDRPLWASTLVEGLDDGRAAYVFTSHHSVADGMGAIELLGMLHSRTRAPMVDRPEPAPPAGEAITPLGVLVDELIERGQRLPGAGLRLAGQVAGWAGGALTGPRETVAESVDFARSLARVAGPAPVGGSPLLAARGDGRRFETIEVDMAALKAAGAAAGGSPNDAYLAAVLGGLRRYHEAHGVPVDRLPVAVPVGLRATDDPLSGNRFAGARFAAPVGEPDPAARVRACREFVLDSRDEPALDAVGVLAPLLSRLPARAVTGLASGAASTDVQVSTVPGISEPVYMAGARIERMFPFGPLPGCAAMVTMLTHRQVACIGATLDTAAVGDPDLFRTSLIEGFDEVLALA